MVIDRMEAGFQWRHAFLREAETDSDLLHTSPREIQQGFIYRLTAVQVHITRVSWDTAQILAGSATTATTSQTPVHSSQLPASISPGPHVIYSQ